MNDDLTPHADGEQPIFTTPQSGPTDPAIPDDHEETDEDADESTSETSALADAIPEVGSTVE